MAKYSPFTFSDGTPNQVSAARLNEIGAGIREASMGRSTTFPSSPVDGDIHVYPADTTNGVMWHFMYRSGSASAHKWEYIGGAPLYDQSETDGTVSSTSYVDPTTAPTMDITVPKAGDYEVTWGFRANINTGDFRFLAAVKVGAAAASDDDSCMIWTPTATNTPASAQRSKVFTAAASDVLKVQYRGSAAVSMTITSQWLHVRPVRVTP